MPNRLKLTASTLHIPFKVAFKHNTATRSETSTFWVKAIQDQWVGAGEGCPRPYVTGETEESCMQFFNQWSSEWLAMGHLEQLNQWAEAHSSEIDQNLSAWCAVEMAFLDLWAQKSETTIPQLLGFAHGQGEATYTAVLGDASPQTWSLLCDWHLKNEMKDFKLKVNGNPTLDSERMQYILERCPQAFIRWDANNMWTSAKEALNYLLQLPEGWVGIEEPLAVPNWDELHVLTKAIQGKIILDEHVVKLADLDKVQIPERMVLNLRVSKCGGIQRSIALAQAAIDKGIQVIIGAQVGESSALTRAGLIVTHALGGKVLANEGGYGLNLLEKDYFRTLYQFGPAGKLNFKF